MLTLIAQSWICIAYAFLAVVTGHPFVSVFSSALAIYLCRLHYVKLGYAGLMLRDPHGVYKCGCSTVREGILLKMKRFSDMEGTVVGFVERMHNGNEATKDNLGRTKRSTAKAGKVGMDTLGALRLRITGWPSNTVEVGSGYTDDERQFIWQHRAELLGKQVTFKYQAAGSKDAPRFPVFKCFREDV